MTNLRGTLCSCYKTATEGEQESQSCGGSSLGDFCALESHVWFVISENSWYHQKGNFEWGPEDFWWICSHHILFGFHCAVSTLARFLFSFSIGENTEQSNCAEGHRAREKPTGTS